MKIAVVGVGGAGLRALEHVAQARLHGTRCIAADTASSALDACSLRDRLLIGRAQLRGLGSGGSMDAGRAAARDSLPELLAFAPEATRWIFLAGLGGGTGAGVLLEWMHRFRQQERSAALAISLPFTFEGEIRQRNAQTAYAALEGLLPVNCVAGDALLGHLSGTSPDVAAAQALLVQALAWQALALITRI